MHGLLNITEAMSIALHACASLAENPGTFQSARKIAQRYSFSPHHFAKVVQQLVRAGLLETERGPSGGARLTRAPESITLLEIYIAAGGMPHTTGCLLRSNICGGSHCPLGKFLDKENRRLVELLEKMSLASAMRSFKNDEKRAMCAADKSRVPPKRDFAKIKPQRKRNEA